jgi:DnaJ-class molecular chaperone
MAGRWFGKFERVMKKCKTCKGKGKLTGKMIEGTGRKSITCPWCKGRGFVFAPPKK